jgi:hypothetical protein
VSRALGTLTAAATDHRWRDRPEFEGLRGFIFDAGELDPSWDDDDPKVLAAFADNPERVDQIRKLAPYLDEAGWHGDMPAAAKALGFEYP